MLSLIDWIAKIFLLSKIMHRYSHIKPKSLTLLSIVGRVKASEHNSHQTYYFPLTIMHIFVDSKGVAVTRINGNIF